MAKIVFSRSDTKGNFELEFNNQQLMPEPAIRLVHGAGGSDYREARASWSAPKGWAIMGIQAQVNSEYGEKGYSTQTSAEGESFERIDHIYKSVEGLIAEASERGDEKTAETLRWLLKYTSDYYSKVSSTHSRLDVFAWAQSREIKVGPVIVDTITAHMDVSFFVVLIKLITPEEFESLRTFLAQAIADGASITRSFS
jgi:hypothetical protein